MDRLPHLRLPVMVEGLPRSKKKRPIQKKREAMPKERNSGKKFWMRAIK